ncbi:hypothetical protein [Paenochrobactrum pullorum]|uniref:hypothetical protein n=1 Tax=Paenochrobactrum pullorum TaxID=1324351 RepID=UPI0035BBCC31
MEQAVRINNIDSITVADISLVKDDEERVSHKRLAFVLGMKQHHKLRHLVERNIEEFQRYGEVSSTVDETTKKGGRPSQVVWLNEGQSILAAVRSDAPKAPEVRHQIITAFMEYRRGRIEKPIEVRKHKRRTSTPVDTAIKLSRTASRLEAVADKIQPKMPDMCAMVINGESVFVDIHKFDGAGRAVTLGHDGVIKIEYVEPTTSDYKPMGERFALGERYRSPCGRIMQNGVAVLGMVIEQGQSIAMQSTAMQPMQIEHEPVKRMAVIIGHPNQSAPYRDKILALLGTGLSKTQIAEKVGCSYHGVDYWARKARQLG